jgi:transcriptional regulator with XRE-family HTH domain
MELIDRFRYIMKINQLSASAFADEIGVQRSSVSHVLSGRNKPSLEFIQKVLKRYPKVDGNWLISGSTQIDKEKISLEEDNSSKQEVSKSPKTDDLPKEKITSNTDARSIQRILVFYNDNTFEEYKP